MQQHFLLSTCETIIRFISLIAFSFNLNITTFHVVGKLDLTILVSNFEVISPLKKKFIITFKSKVIDLEEDEERTYSNEMWGGGGKELQATTIEGNLKEKLKPNLDQVIDKIQVEPVESIEPIELIIKPTQLVVVVAKSSQPVQLFIEPVHVENP